MMKGNQLKTTVKFNVKLYLHNLSYSLYYLLNVYININDVYFEIK